MAPTHLLYRAATGRDVPPGPTPCVLCGAAHAGGLPAGDVIRDTFTNHGLCRVPGSDSVCPACGHYFNHRWEVGQKYLSEYRKHSLLVTPAAWQPWPRPAMRLDLETLLAAGAREPLLLVIGLSKKKHCLPLAKVNPPGARHLYVQLEEEGVLVTPDAWAGVAGVFDALLAQGCRKGEVLGGNYSPATLRRAPSLSRLLAAERALAPWRPSGLLSLVSYVTLVGDGDDARDDADIPGTGRAGDPAGAGRVPPGPLGATG
jgi:hypothetical protein